MATIFFGSLDDTGSLIVPDNIASQAPPILEDVAGQFTTEATITLPTIREHHVYRLSPGQTVYFLRDHFITNVEDGQFFTTEVARVSFGIGEFTEQQDFLATASGASLTQIDDTEALAEFQINLPSSFPSTISPSSTLFQIEAITAPSAPGDYFLTILGEAVQLPTQPSGGGRYLITTDLNNTLEKRNAFWGEDWMQWFPPPVLFSEMPDVVDFDNLTLAQLIAIDTLMQENGDHEPFIYEALGDNDNVFLPSVSKRELRDGVFYDGAAEFKAGAGNDTITGRDGNDIVSGGPGGDQLTGGSGNDNLDGDIGNDTLKGDVGNDTLKGGDGADLIDGAQGNDSLEGGTGNDTLQGGDDSDTLKGGDDNDLIEGGQGFDTLQGGDGTDTLRGEGGDDLIEGGAGDDIGFGGGGSDRFRVNRDPARNDGSNEFYGGDDPQDPLDFLNLNSVDLVQYDQPKSNFTLRADPLSVSHGVVLIATHDATGETDRAFFVDELQFSDGTSWSQADVLEAGWLAFVFMSLDGAFTQLQEILPLPEIDDDDPNFSSGFKKFLGWITIGQKIAQAGAEIASTASLQEAIQRASVIAAREAIFPVVDQARDWIEDNIDVLPTRWQEPTRERLDQLELEFKTEVLLQADNFGNWYAVGTESFGQALGGAAFDLWDNLQGFLNNKLTDQNPNGNQIQSAEDFGLDSVELDPALFKEPPLIPDPKSSDESKPTDQEDIIILPPLAFDVEGTLSELDGDTIFSFDSNDNIVAVGETFGQESVTVKQGSAILDIDSNLDGITDATITLIGDFQGVDFQVENVAGNTQISILAGNAGPVGLPFIVGAAIVGQKLAADFSNVSDLDGIDSTTVDYQWLRDGFEIEGANLETYMVAPEDVGASISVSVSYTDLIGAPEQLTSDATEDVSAANAPQTIELMGQGYRESCFFSTDSCDSDVGFGPVTAEFTLSGDHLALASVNGLQTVHGSFSNATFSYFDNVEGEVLIETDDLISDGERFMDLQGSTFDLQRVTIGANVTDVLIVSFWEESFDSINYEFWFPLAGPEFPSLDSLNLFGDPDDPNTPAFQDIPDGPLEAGNSFSLIAAAAGGLGAPPFSFEGELITGTEADDALNGTGGRDTISGLAGDDVLNGLEDDDIILGEEGNDTLLGGDGDDTIAGGDGDDSIEAGAGDDNISASDGNDFVDAGAGNDSVGGGIGNDTSFGGDGDDVIGAGFGDDSVSGGTGNDVVAGGAGNDTLDAGDGNDSVSGSFGNDLIDAGEGADDIGGGTGRDTIDAGAGDDMVGAGEGDDNVFGGAGNDFLAGGGRNDTIDGGAGNDTINAGAGNDVITGGAGADQFVFASFFDGEADIVTDFEDGVDSFFIRRNDPDTGVENINNGGNGLAGFVAAMNIIDTDAGAQMSVNGNTVLVQGITAAQLTVDDFQFL